MNLSREQLEQLELMGRNLISPEMAAINLEVDELEFLTELHTVGSDVRRAYYRGYIKQIIETRQALIKAAHNGSNPAQMELLKMMNRLQNELKHV